MNIPKIVKIDKIQKETKDIKTIYFNYSGEVKPGQFFMVWIPGVDEIPMSVSVIDKKIKGFTFRKVGEATEKLYKLKEGDLIGIRGPYGNYFKPRGKKILFVGGGTGIAMLSPAIELAIQKKIKCSVIIGVKNKEELFFYNRLKESGAKLHVSTDDGSKGFKGFACDLAKDVLSKEKFDLILTCGPEIMMKTLFECSKDIDFQASLERYMKCAIGICGQCCIGEGIRVCHDGPIFDRKTLDKIEDFGLFKRDSSGKKIKI